MALRLAPNLAISYLTSTARKALGPLKRYCKQLLDRDQSGECRGTVSPHLGGATCLQWAGLTLRWWAPGEDPSFRGPICTGLRDCHRGVTNLGQRNSLVAGLHKFQDGGHRAGSQGVVGPTRQEDSTRKEPLQETKFGTFASTVCNHVRSKEALRGLRKEYNR
ncbi:hypothetical protein NDU88_004694 [Pleurodeles waltl]|uniref:Uncharacterized protein n=1 Tax=Pleurodeles waltl TaxID=8319 RepID=A0AAV7W8L3_PLEWA|nr:hypothetical protein NDU88_004694 [Pleurodeles waltl]